MRTSVLFKKIFLLRLLLVLFAYYAITSTISGQNVNLKFGEMVPVPKEFPLSYSILDYQDDNVLFYGLAGKIKFIKMGKDMSIKNLSETEVPSNLLTIYTRDKNIYAIFLYNANIVAYIFDATTLQKKDEKVLIPYEAIHNIHKEKGIGRFKQAQIGAPNTVRVKLSPNKSYIAISVRISNYLVIKENTWVFNGKLEKVYESFFAEEEVDMPKHSTCTTNWAESVTDNGTYIKAEARDYRYNVEGINVKNGLDQLKVNYLFDSDNKSALKISVVTTNGKREHDFGMVSDSVNLGNLLITSSDDNKIQLNCWYSKYSGFSGRLYGCVEGMMDITCNLADNSFKIDSIVRFPQAQLEGSGKRWKWRGLKMNLWGKSENTRKIGHIFFVSNNIVVKSQTSHDFIWTDENYQSPKQYSWGQYKTWSSDKVVWLRTVQGNRYYDIENKDGNIVARSFNYDGDYQESIIDASPAMTDSPSLYEIGNGEWLLYQKQKINKQTMHRLGVLTIE